MTRTYYTADNYDSGSSIGYLIRHASKLITHQIAALFSAQDISFMQYVIMMLLRDGLATTAAEIGHNLCYDSGALTRVIDQLEERGFVKRERHAHDKRIIELKLTDIGNETLDLFCPAVFTYYNKILINFSREEVEHLLQLLTRLLTGLTTSPSKIAEEVEAVK